MKNYLFLAFWTMCLLSCRKPRVTNNYYTPATSHSPAFVVNGITDVSFTNNFSVFAMLNLTVEHVDSVQEYTTLSVSGLPAGVIIDTNWVHSGIPTFATTLYLYDTGVVGGAAPGNYPVTLTATTTSGKQKSFTFNVRVKPMPTGFLGKYTNCFRYCSTTENYQDSVYLDPVVVNKVWFTNYGNSGHLVYGMLTGQGGGLVIPDQVIGGNTYNGSGSVSAGHSINISINGSCALNMF